MITVTGRVITPEQIIDNGVVRIEGDRIVSIDRGTAPGDAVRADFVLPGLVDLHCHGGGGASVEQDAAAVSAFHAAHGTTSLLASMMTAPAAELAARLHTLAPLVADGTVLGVHLEGPYLSPARRGAHPIELLRAPDLAEAAGWQGTGIVRMITLAPELPFASKLIEQLVADGTVAAIGHTDADGEQCRSAVAAGARVATHLWNGMPPLQHRNGGPVAALLTDPRVVCELIADGHHLDDEVLRLSLAALGPDRVILVSDATPAAGCPDGDYRLGEVDVRLSDGRITTADGRSLAGSTLTLIDAVRHVVALGYPLIDAIRAAATIPARVVSADDIGQISVGRRADLVLTDGALAVQAVLQRGVWQ